MTFAFRGTDSTSAWRDWHRTNVDVSEGAARIAPAPEPSYGSPEALPVDFEPVDLATDECGDLYLLAPTGDVHRYDPVRGDVQELSCTWRAEDAGDAVAIAVTSDSVYLAGADGHLQAYARRLRQTRWVLSAPLTAPVALATRSDTVLVLDRGTDGSDDDDAGFLATVRDGGVTERVVTDLAAPVDVAAAGGRTHVLTEGDANRPLLATYDDSFDPMTSTRVPEDLAAACLAAEPDGHPIVGVGVADGEPAPARYRDSAFHRIDGASGATSVLMHATPAGRGRPAGLYAVLGAPLVDGDPRPHFREATTVRQSNDVTDRYDAQLVRRVDSGERDTQWHRLTTDFSLDTTGTQVRVRYLATNDEDLQYSDAPVSLKAVDGIGDTFAARLRAAGIRGLSELVEQSPDRVARAAGAEGPSVSIDRVADWFDEGRSLVASRTQPIDPSEIYGIGPTFATRLADAGIEDVATLLDRTPAAIARVVSGGVTDAEHSRAAAWIEAARDELAVRDDVRGLEWRTVEVPDPRDALLRDAEGRYLWVELDLVGDHVRTPTVDAFRAYFPRQSYLRHLPACYREDAESETFLEQFLSIFESAFTDVDEELGAITRYFDPRGVPLEAISWLGDWLALEAGEAWPAPARRDLVERAPSLYKRRGTRGGLLDVLRIYLRHTAAYRAHLGDPDDGASSEDGNGGEPCPPQIDAGTSASRANGVPTGQAVYLLEYSDLDCIDDPAVRRTYERLVPCPQCFLVLLRSWFDDEAARTVDRIVDHEQPAHTVGNAVQLRPWAQLGGTAFLGVNSRLPSRDFTVEESSLGADSVLGQREPDGQLGIASTIGGDTTIS